MKLGNLRRIVGADGVGRLWLVDDSNGDPFAVSGKVLRDAGVVHPACGDAFEFIAMSDGTVTQLRKVAS